MIGTVTPVIDGPVETLHLSCLDTDGETVIRASGELDATTCNRLRQLLANAIRHGVARITVDLSGITFIDSSGLGALLANYVAAERVGLALRVVEPSERVLRVLELTGTHSRLVASA